MAHIATPAFAGAVSTSGGVTTQYKPNKNAMQRAGAAITAALVCLNDKAPGQHAADLAVILHCRLDADALLWLAGATCLALPPDDVEILAEAALNDLRAGPPIPPFLSLRDDALSWAMFASRAELCHYMAAAWGELSPDDRKRFLRRAM